MKKGRKCQAGSRKEMVAACCFGRVPTLMLLCGSAGPQEPADNPGFLGLPRTNLVVVSPSRLAEHYAASLSTYSISNCTFMVEFQCLACPKHVGQN